MIRITSVTEGFRRAGISFSAAPTLYREDDLTPAQIEAIEAEPMLTLERIDPPLDDAATIAQLLSGSVKEAVAKLADASEEIRAQALAAEQAKTNPRPGVLKALGAQSGPKINSQ